MLPQPLTHINKNWSDYLLHRITHIAPRFKMGTLLDAQPLPFLLISQIKGQNWPMIGVSL